jgi:hypothetical protein
MLCYAIVVTRFQFPVLFEVLAFVAHSQCDATVSLAFILKVDIKNASCVRETVVPSGEFNKEWSALCAMKPVRVASCAAVTSFAQGV